MDSVLSGTSVDLLQTQARVKSEMNAPPLAGPAAGVTVCAPAGIAVLAANINKRKFRLMISFVHICPCSYYEDFYRLNAGHGCTFTTHFLGDARP
jgi:hypothetical protein